MPFVKGKSGNPNGKEAGTKSKKTIEWESFGHDILSNGSERAKKIMSSCDDEMFMDYYVKLLEYFKPKLARTEVKQEGVIETNITFKRDK